VITEVKTKPLYQAENPPSAIAELTGNVALVKKGQPKGKYTVLEIKAIIENKGGLPTHIARGASLALNREDVVWLLGDRNKIKFLLGTPWQRIGVLEGQLKIPVVSPREETAPRSAQRPQAPGGPSGFPGFPGQRPGQPVTEAETVKPLSPSAREVTWVIAIEGQSPLKIVVSSQKGGTKVKEVSFE